MDACEYLKGTRRQHHSRNKKAAQLSWPGKKQREFESRGCSSILPPELKCILQRTAEQKGHKSSKRACNSSNNNNSNKRAGAKKCAKNWKKKTRECTVVMGILYYLYILI